MSANSLSIRQQGGEQQTPERRHASTSQVLKQKGVHGGLLVDLCKVDLLNAGMASNLPEDSAVPSAHHQHLLRLALLRQQCTPSVPAAS